VPDSEGDFKNPAVFSREPGTGNREPNANLWNFGSRLPAPGSRPNYAPVTHPIRFVGNGFPIPGSIWAET